ncbi:MAG: dihydropyrimidinase [Bacillota bacterium]|nr:MAG: dihydropyrimidinase [Bacillota bacterium]
MPAGTPAPPGDLPDLVIRGALAVGLAGTFTADIGISGGRIVALADNLRGGRELDARGLVALPGIIDPHVHLEDIGAGGTPTADDFASGTASALAGGVTTILDFASPAPGGDYLEAFATRREQAARGSRVDFGLHCCLPAGGEDPSSAIAALVREGVTSFKVFMVYAGLAQDSFQLFRAMRAVAAQGAVLMAHAETGTIIDGLVDEFLARGDTTPIYHAYSRPALCEEAAVVQALALHRGVGGRLYFVHISTRAALERILFERRAPGTQQRSGSEVFIETCPQYLLLSEDRLTGANGERFICSPPLRPYGDREALWESVAAGAIDTIGTDHCPFTIADRSGKTSFAEVPNGLGGIGFGLPLMWTHGVAAGRMTPERLVALMSENPARIFGLWPKKGRIAPGADADIVLVDPSARDRLSVQDLPGNEDYSVYEGIEATARVEYTVSRGEVVYDRRTGVTGEPGRGRYLARPVDASHT